ncbi:sensor domain-containing diguanylate cyclase [Halopseudomonas salegens]|uniref:diguanylate cyclase n=1 Tax=Halopseudomonas salegens TaxID=1434072 RepID=A0A1H2E843_9GAMM|nr:sensor domain-containing diguanylate cyclase [Halopseudomonas salegens]SDT91301.1 sigma-B regulation protein RsbQ [Halopseudomonas salegens]
MPQQKHWGPDDFPCACLVTASPDKQGGQQLLFANAGAAKLLGIASEALVGRKLTELLTPASNIMLDTYLLPLLLHEGECDEVMLDIKTAEGQTIPVVINASLTAGDQGHICWSLFGATRRNQLDQELVKARRQLESYSEQLYQLSVTDELTGLVNRRQLKRRAEQLLAQAKRSKSPISVVVLDIDKFKQVNDTQGHLAGDEILKRLAAVLRAHARESDVVGRYGGEEFSFVLPDTCEADAVILARRLHALVGEIQVAGQPLTISIGVASSERLEEEVNAYETLFELADRAMYEAKMAGRNQTLVARY